MVWATLIVQTLCVNTHFKARFNLKKVEIFFINHHENILIYLGCERALLPTCPHIKRKKTVSSMKHSIYVAALVLSCVLFESAFAENDTSKQAQCNEYGMYEVEGQWHDCEEKGGASPEYEMQEAEQEDAISEDEDFSYDDDQEGVESPEDSN